MKDRDGLDEEREALGLALRRLPTPRPPEALVSRVRRLGHLQLAGRADDRLNHLVLLFLLLFSWTVSLLTVVGVRLLRAGTIDLLGAVAGSALTWSVGAYGAAWISGAAVLVLIGIYGRREGRLA